MILDQLRALFETPLEREVRNVAAAQERDQRKAERLCGRNPICCMSCALGAVDRDLRDRMQRRLEWLGILQAKLERAHASNSSR